MSFFSFGARDKEQKASVSPFVEDEKMEDHREYGVPDAAAAVRSNGGGYPQMVVDPYAPESTTARRLDEKMAWGIDRWTDKVKMAASYLRLPTPLAEFSENASKWRSTLGLPNPGSVEKLGSEYKMAKVDNFLFEGAKAELTKAISIQPLFQVIHALNLASPNSPSRQPAYNLAAIYATSSTLFQASVSDEGSTMFRSNFAWTPRHTTKIQAQLSKQPNGTMAQFEHDYQGDDYTANFKALPTNLADGTGIYTFSYLQSITKRIALGIEGLYQLPDPKMPEIGLSYLAKMTGNDAKGRDWIATATLQGANLSTSYWHRLSDRVDAGTDLTLALVPTPGGGVGRHGLATFGAKYDMRQAQVRAMADSMGKVYCVFEQRLTPIFSFSVSGEIDHAKSASRFGIGISIEAADPALQAQMEAQAASGQAPPPPPV